MARILIVDPHQPSREAMAQLMRARGHEVLRAADGIEGLELAGACRPDLVLCAVSLPGLGARALALLLRADRAAAEMSLVAVGSNDGDDAAARAGLLHAGFDACLAGPPDPERFGAEVEALLPGPEGNLLLVDDDAFMLGVLADVLADARYRLLSARSAEEALALLARRHVEVVLSDQNMPGLQGTELLARVRGLYPDAARLILSGESDRGAIERAEAEGLVDRACCKPWAGAALRAEVARAFLLQRSRAPA
jgi:two-component system cell cycle response regulator